MSVKLGSDQQLWLDKYGSINLSQWRMYIINNCTEWVYVGNWHPTKIKPYPSEFDGGYSIRNENIKNNKYHYWPT